MALRQDGTTGNDKLYGAASGSDGSTVLGGVTEGAWTGAHAGGLEDFCAVKLDADGGEVWRWQVRWRGMFLRLDQSSAFPFANRGRGMVQLWNNAGKRVGAVLACYRSKVLVGCSVLCHRLINADCFHPRPCHNRKKICGMLFHGCTRTYLSLSVTRFGLVLCLC